MFSGEMFYSLVLVGTEIPPPQQLILLAEEIADLGQYHQSGEKSRLREVFKFPDMKESSISRLGGNVVATGMAEVEM